MQLVVQSGTEPGRTYDLTPGAKMSIGRQSVNEIVVNDEQASRRHAEVQSNSDGALVTDNNSANGTFVNGTRISSPVQLRAGDTLQIGTTVLKLVDTQSAASTVPSVYEQSAPASNYSPSTPDVPYAPAQSEQPSYGGGSSTYGQPGSSPSYGGGGGVYEQPQASQYNQPSAYDQTEVSGGYAAQSGYNSGGSYSNPSPQNTPAPSNYDQSYGQQNYGQAGSYDQGQQYGQQNYGQPGYDQNQPYGQPQQYGQSNYGQSQQYGQPQQYDQNQQYGQQQYDPNQQQYGQPYGQQPYGQAPVATPAKKKGGVPVAAIIGVVALIVVVAVAAVLFLFVFSGGGGTGLTDVAAPAGGTKFNVPVSDTFKQAVTAVGMDGTKPISAVGYALKNEPAAVLDTYKNDLTKKGWKITDSTGGFLAEKDGKLTFVAASKVTDQANLDSGFKEVPDAKGKLNIGDTALVVFQGTKKA